MGIIKKILRQINFIFNLVIVAFLILNPAVFLLAPGFISAQSMADNLSVEMINPPVGPVSGTVKLVWRTSVEVDSAYLKIAKEDKMNTAEQQPFSHQAGTDKYIYYWDTTQEENGFYNLKAVFSLSGSTFGPETVTLEVENRNANNSDTEVNNDIDNGENNNEEANIEKTTDNSAEAATDADNRSVASQSMTEQRISFSQTPSFVNGPIVLKAETNFTPTKVLFLVSGPKNVSYFGQPASSQVYYFHWDLDNGFPFGQYEITAQAIVDGVAVSEDKITVKYEEEKIDVEEPAAEEEIEVKLFLPAVVSGEKKVEVVLNLPTGANIDKVEFSVSGNNILKKFIGQKEDNEHYYFIWPTSQFKNGDYRVEVGVIAGGVIIVKTIGDVKVNNEIKSAKEIKENKNKEDFNQLLVQALEKKNIPKNISVKDKPATVKTKVIIKDKGDFILPECTKHNIKTVAACKEFMTLPVACRDKGITSSSTCRAFLAKPAECREKEISSEKCKEFLALPAECRQAGFKTGEECRAYLLKWALPETCQKAGIINQKDCQNFLLKQALPAECRQAGLENEEECKKYLSKKEVTPLICQRAQITGPEECQKFLASSWQACDGRETASSCTPIIKEVLPAECARVKIFNQKKCQTFLKIKLPAECRAAGAADEKACNRLLFQKYIQPQCTQLNLGAEECENYLFNKYSSLVECQSDNNWRCLLAIKEKLGLIAGQENKFKKIKEKIKDKIGVSIRAEELIKELAESGAALPVKEKKIKFKLISVKEGLALNKQNDFYSTAPMAIIVDTDGDGLPDDLEKRLGTNPAENDSDGDGYSDGVEIENNYNPLGPGKVGEVKMAPVERAILTNQIFDQPKASGGHSPIFKVKAVRNWIETRTTSTKASTATGYVISGQAATSSIVTLYIYSDLPIVATVKTDEFGNWQYEFDHPLSDGEHEVYVALNDQTGKIIAKSQPLNFFIKEARAVTVDEFVRTLSPTPTRPAESMMTVYLVMAGLIIVVSILFFIIFFLVYKNRITSG